MVVHIFRYCRSDDAEEEENKTYVDSSDDEQSLRPSEITRHKRKRTGEQSTSCPPKRSTFIAKFRRAFENCWIRLLKCRIPRTLFQTLLLEIPTKGMYVSDIPNIKGHARKWFSFESF